jgi:hypothetical protein
MFFDCSAHETRSKLFVTTHKDEGNWGDPLNTSTKPRQATRLEGGGGGELHGARSSITSTPWCRIFFEKLIVTQLVKEYSFFI